MDKTLKRINELARLSKERELTEEEKAEQVELRKEYIKSFRAGFRNVLLNTKVVDEKGDDVTPEALKRAQKEHKE
ncbi:MAG: DUF896 domain-containing protein [Tissierellia bacterium]|nr:DUF896 domain-containing protein [Tissierellia bacterium]